MKNKLRDYLDAEIPDIKGKKGIRRIISFMKAMRYNPSYNAVFLLRYCYVYNDKPTCSSIYQIGTENTATIAVFSYYNSGAVIIDESGTVTVYLANHSGGVE